MGRPTEDMTGRRVGMLRVTGQAGADRGRRMMWACICECGRTTVARGDHLRNDKVKSCGQCGAFHPQALTSANAKFLVRTFEAPGRWSGRKVRFGAAFVRETGLLACEPRIPTYIYDAFASALSGLAVAGLIRAKEGRTTAYRWGQEERCVLESATACDSEQELANRWMDMTGKLLDTDAPRKSEAEAAPMGRAEVPATGLLADWNRDE